MSKTLQIVELMLNVMEKDPGRYKVEVTAKGICIMDFLKLRNGQREIPEYFTYFYKPVENYEIECNKQFDEFIGGLKA